MVVGAADESDAEIYDRMANLYDDLKLKRVYYQAFRPAKDTPLEEHPATPPMREHRLYQLDWLHRFYEMSKEEMALAFDSGGFLDLETDPKMAIALEQADRFPVDVNSAPQNELMRVPGIGPISAERIMRQRADHRIDSWRELQTMGVVAKHARPFLVLPGYRPTPAKQGVLPLWEAHKEERETKRARMSVATPLPMSQTHGAPCGLRGSCTGCALAPLHGMTQSAGRPTTPRSDTATINQENMAATAVLA